MQKISILVYFQKVLDGSTAGSKKPEKGQICVVWATDFESPLSTHSFSRGKKVVEITADINKKTLLCD